MVTFVPLSYGVGIFGWLIVLALLGWFNEQ
jgi:hypothetical protein